MPLSQKKRQTSKLLARVSGREHSFKHMNVSNSPLRLPFYISHSIRTQHAVVSFAPLPLTRTLSSIGHRSFRIFCGFVVHGMCLVNFKHSYRTYTKIILCSLCSVLLLFKRILVCFSDDLIKYKIPDLIHRNHVECVIIRLKETVHVQAKTKKNCNFLIFSIKLLVNSTDFLIF